MNITQLSTELLVCQTFQFKFTSNFKGNVIFNIIIDGQPVQPQHCQTTSVNPENVLHVLGRSLPCFRVLFMLSGTWALLPPSIN